jgi:transketolase C-terminal domain/subunit
MCERCSDVNNTHRDFGRRGFLTGAMAATALSAAAGLAWSGTAMAKAKTPPKPENVL